MSYTIKNTQGTTVAVVPDRQIDTTSTSLNLVGYNASNYGVPHSDNFVWLMENFAADTPPPHPIEGQLWWDTVNAAMKVYHDGSFLEISGAPSVSGGAFDDGLSAVYHCDIPGVPTSVLLVFAGGKLVAVVASVHIAPNFIPASVIINAIEYVFESVFPLGLEPGVNLAADSNNYSYIGDVPIADQSRFTGGGRVNAPAGWTFFDTGTKSVALMVADGNIIAALAKVPVALSELPSSITVKNTHDDHTHENVVMQFSSKFPGGLSAGITFATGAGLGQYDSIIASQTASFTGTLGTAIANATQSIETWVDNNSATAQALTSLEATFTSLTGTSSVAAAIQQIIATASNSGAATQAITDLKAQFTTATGTASFADALTKLSSAADATSANTTALNSLTSSFTGITGTPNVAAAIQSLYTAANSTQALAGYSLSLDSNGYAIGLDALNGGPGNNYIKFKTDHFQIGSDSLNFIPFSIDNGIITMHNVQVDTLKVNTAIIPARISASNSFYGTSNASDASNGIQPTNTVVSQLTIHVPVAGWLEVDFNCKQAFTNGLDGRPWTFRAYVNNTFLPESLIYGNVPGDSVVVSGQYYAATPGDYNVQIFWEGHYTISMQGRSLFVKGYPNTQ